MNTICYFTIVYAYSLQLALLSNCQMNQIAKYLSVLKAWRLQERTDIKQALEKISAVKSFKLPDYQSLLVQVTIFHRDIVKAKEEDVDVCWFPIVIALKKKLKSGQENELQKQKKAAQLKKPKPVLTYPEALTDGKRPHDHQVLKSLYRSFLSYFQEEAKSKNTIPFIHALLKELKSLLEDQSESAYFKRVNSICIRLSRQTSRQAKSKMLINQITPSQLAKDKQQIYFDERAWQELRKNQLAQLQESQSGFYEQMRKTINKDACEQCRFCHQKKAYCETMKQIRASDEPMTRFMRCNACSKAWRD